MVVSKKLDMFSGYKKMIKKSVIIFRGNLIKLVVRGGGGETKI